MEHEGCVISFHFHSVSIELCLQAEFKLLQLSGATADREFDFDIIYACSIRFIVFGKKMLK